MAMLELKIHHMTDASARVGLATGALATCRLGGAVLQAPAVLDVTTRRLIVMTQVLTHMSSYFVGAIDFV